MNLTIDHLRQIFTTATDKALEDFFNVFFVHAADYGIDTTFRINAFLAQVLAEVGTDLESVRENLNYRCSALQHTFGYYRRNPARAVKDGRCNGHKANQIGIGNRAYANRIGNGGVNSGDGYRFRGGGFFQLTGRGNYTKIGMMLPEPVTAEYLADNITRVEYGLLSAMAFWKKNNIHKKSRNIDDVTRIINKHTNSYSKRKRHYQRIVGITA